MNDAEIDVKIEELDTWIRQAKHTALKEFFVVTGKNSSVHVMHAHFGRNNNTFVDAIRTQFTGPEDFIARWIQGLDKKLRKLEILAETKSITRLTNEEVIYHSLQNPILKEYIFKFLERNFYRNFRARIRAKPHDNLWRIWFGAGNLCWGLVISPALRNTEMTKVKCDASVINIGLLDMS